MSQNPSTAQPHSSEKVALVVDDIPSVRYYHSYILKKAGFRCEAASNGADALQKLLNGTHIDLAVIDIMMPSMNGLELIKQIRKIPAYIKLPILVISSEPAAAEVAGNTGPIGFVKKPLSPDPVIKEVNRLLQLAKS